MVINFLSARYGFVPYTAIMLILVGCARTTATAVDAGRVRQEIARLNEQTYRWWDAGLVDSIAGLYAEDATMIENNEAPIRGRAAIRQRLYPGNPDTVVVHMRGVSDDVRVADTIAVEKGHVSIDLRRKPPADTTKSLYQYRGNYITVWVLRSGAWQILYDMDASEPGSRVMGSSTS